MKKRLLSLMLLATTVAFVSCKKDEDPDPDPIDNSTTYTQTYFDNGTYVTSQIAVNDKGEGTGTMTWEKENTYILDGFVFVNDGQTLTIEAGTVIKGKSGQGENASALIVAQGGTLIAEGTVSMPIVFTSELDETARDTTGAWHDGDNLAVTQPGLWGGLIVLGKADITAGTTTRAIEGIPTSEPRGSYGGSNDADNSGTYKYISIRHGGTNIGSGNEINGLTLGGVGTGTTVDYIEVIGNADDGVEWFGGSVNTKHLLVAFCGDEAFDYDEGFKGLGQYWFGLQTDGVGSDQGGEHDGGASDCETCLPYATPMIYNATYLGSGSNRLLTFRDNAGGTYGNSIFYNYADGIRIENLSSGGDSWARYQGDSLNIINCVFYQVADETAAGIMEINGTADAAGETTLTNDFATDGNVIDVALPIAAYSITDNNTLDPRASSTAATADGAAEPSGSFFDNVSYHGAFSSSTNWAATWSTLSKRNYLAP